MSEKLYAVLLRLFPSHFRRSYGEDALQLFRDRAREETGFPSRFRLWLDLLADLAISVPREYFYAQPELLSASASQTPGSPSFYVLQEDAPRPGSLVFGFAVSVAGLLAFSVLLSGGVNSQLRRSRSQYRAFSHPSSASKRPQPTAHPPLATQTKTASSSSQQPPASAASGPTSKSALPSRNAHVFKLHAAQPPSAASGAASAVVAERAGLQIKNPSPTRDGRWIPSASDQSPYYGEPLLKPQPPDIPPAGGVTANAPAGSGPVLDPQPLSAAAALIHSFDTHDIVLFGEIHGNKQEYEFLRSLVSDPQFADRVDDIVVEFGNSLYQKSVDRYISGEDIPLEQVQRAWRNLVGAVGPPSPVYATFYRAVREMNLRRRGRHQMRVLCGDPYIDWDKVQVREDIAPFLGNREQWYTQVVKDQVVAKHHHALLIMGSGHFLRRPGAGQRSPSIEQQLRLAGASTYLVVVGTNTDGAYDELDHRFDAWTPPVVFPLADGWPGELAATPVVSGGIAQPGAPVSNSAATGVSSPPVTKLRDVADALLYLGPRDSLVAVRMTRAELDATPYGKEIARRLSIEGFPEDFVSQQESGSAEVPQFPRPQPNPTRAHSAMSLPPPPKNMNAPLPPRPPSQ